VRREPQRTCVGCRQVRPKGSLLRLARGPDGVVTVDRTGRAAGRGAYVCRQPRCVKEMLKPGRLGRAFRTEAVPSPDLVALAAATAGDRSEG
jgi:predicted RNA-binding protein YlxR (DUF448 family)